MQDLLTWHAQQDEASVGYCASPITVLKWKLLISALQLLLIQPTMNGGKMKASAPLYLISIAEALHPKLGACDAVPRASKYLNLGIDLNSYRVPYWNSM